VKDEWEGNDSRLNIRIKQEGRDNYNHITRGVALSDQDN